MWIEVSCRSECLCVQECDDLSNGRGPVGEDAACQPPPATCLTSKPGHQRVPVLYTHNCKHSWTYLAGACCKPPPFQAPGHCQGQMACCVSVWLLKSCKWADWLRIRMRSKKSKTQPIKAAFAVPVLGLEGSGSLTACLQQLAWCLPTCAVVN